MPLVDATSHHLGDPRAPAPDNLQGLPGFSPFAFSVPALVRRRMDARSWSDIQTAKPARV